MSSTTLPSPTSSSPSHPTNTRLSQTKSTLSFLLDPRSGPRPTHLRTRALLRTLRYLTIFAFWRLVRYAKYAAVGAIVAAVSGTLIGSVASGAAFVLAPTGILGGAGAGLIWAVAKFGFRRAGARVKRSGVKDGARGTGDARRDERVGAEGGEVGNGRERGEGALRVEPW